MSHDTRYWISKKRFQWTAERLCEVLSMLSRLIWVVKVTARGARLRCDTMAKSGPGAALGGHVSQAGNAASTWGRNGPRAA